MTQMQAEQWIVPSRDSLAESRLCDELGVPPLVAAVLVQRGLNDPESARKFLHPTLDDLHDPSLLPDYEAARDAILGARERKELIFIHGDYDVDGVTSASILHRFLNSIGCKVQTHVPHRMKEGYGIHLSAVDAAKAAGAKLFLTCDCGSSAIEQIEAAHEAGMKVVVTDHHTIGAEAPVTEAFVNPHRADSTYLFQDLSGAGVVLKLCAGITRDIGMQPHQFYRAFLDLAALGTIADVMPLVGENRIIAKFGLERLSDTKKIGLQALKKVTELTGKITAYHVGFVLGPRLNAAGRIDDAAIALQLLLETDELKAMELAQQIEVINVARRAETQRILEEAVAMVQEKGLDGKNLILIGNEGWHAGIVGIVAGRLVEQFRRPVFVASLSSDGKTAKASGRSIAKFNLADALRANMEILLGGGGHAMAAGCSFEYDKLDTVAEALHHYAGQFLTEEDFVLRRHADVEVAPAEVTHSALEAMQMLEPFGCANPTPVFVSRGLKLDQLMPTRNPEHVRVTLRDGESAPIQAMGFGLGSRLAEVVPGAVADLLFEPCLDEWNGRVTLKWHIKDFAL